MWMAVGWHGSRSSSSSFLSRALEIRMAAMPQEKKGGQLKMAGRP